MILPILISVSLAPGSYFFCALAGFAIAAATASAVKAIKFARTGIVPSRSTNYFSQVWQVAGWLASTSLLPRDETMVGQTPIATVTRAIQQPETSLLARLFGPRHDLDHLAFVIVWRIGLGP